jgi:hypothetical protein
MRPAGIFLNSASLRDVLGSETSIPIVGISMSVQVRKDDDSNAKMACNCHVDSCSQVASWLNVHTKFATSSILSHLQTLSERASEQSQGTGEEGRKRLLAEVVLMYSILAGREKDTSEIKIAFTQQNLVYHDSGKWFSTGDVVWENFPRNSRYEEEAILEGGDDDDEDVNVLASLSHCYINSADDENVHMKHFFTIRLGVPIRASANHFLAL